MRLLDKSFCLRALGLDAIRLRRTQLKLAPCFKADAASEPLQNGSRAVVQVPGIEADIGRLRWPMARYAIWAGASPRRTPSPLRLTPERTQTLM